MPFHDAEGRYTGGPTDPPVHGSEADALRRFLNRQRATFAWKVGGIEEYARHVGQADLLREAIDGLTGQDPPDEDR